MAENNEVKLTAKLDDQVSPAIKKMADNVDTAAKKVDQSSTSAASGIDKQAKAAKKAAYEAEMAAKAAKFQAAENDRLAQSHVKLNTAQEQGATTTKAMGLAMAAGSIAASVLHEVIMKAQAAVAKATESYMEMNRELRASGQLYDPIIDGQDRLNKKMQEGERIAGQFASKFPRLLVLLASGLNPAAAFAQYGAESAAPELKTSDGSVGEAKVSNKWHAGMPIRPDLIPAGATDDWSRKTAQSGYSEMVRAREKAADAAEREAKAQDRIWAKRLGTDKFDMGTYGDARLFRTGQKYRDAAQGDATFNYTPVPGYDYDVSDMKGETARNATLKQQEMIANSYERSREMARRFTSTMLQGLADMDRAGKITFRSLTALLLQLVDVLASGKAADALGGMFQTFASTDPATDASRGRSAGD